MTIPAPKLLIASLVILALVGAVIVSQADDSEPGVVEAGPALSVATLSPVAEDVRVALEAAFATTARIGDAAAADRLPDEWEIQTIEHWRGGDGAVVGYWGFIRLERPADVVGPWRYLTCHDRQFLEYTQHFDSAIDISFVTLSDLETVVQFGPAPRDNPRDWKGGGERGEIVAVHDASDGRLLGTFTLNEEGEAQAALCPDFGD